MGPIESPLTHLVSEADGVLDVQFFQSKDGLRVLISLEDHRDKGVWIHVSVSRKEKYPTWEELKDVKDAFIGTDKVAIQFLPKAKDYLNIHENCFHLWCVLDKDPFPDLSL